MTAAYRTTEKKCATCRWWNGGRCVEFRANEPFYVQADSQPAPCSAKGNAKTTAANTCLRWSPWEKL